MTTDPQPSHTPEPWYVEEIDEAVYLRGANGHIIAEIGDMGRIE